MNRKQNVFNKENRMWLKEVEYLKNGEHQYNYTSDRKLALVKEKDNFNFMKDSNFLKVYVEDIVIEVLDFEYDIDIEVDFKAPQFFTAYKGNIKDIELLKMQFEEEIELDYNDYLEIRVLEMEYEVYE